MCTRARMCVVWCYGARADMVLVAAEEEAADHWGRWDRGWMGGVRWPAAVQVGICSRLCDVERRYVDYLFPDESGSMASLKILEAARAWKKQKAAEEGGQ